MIRQRSETEAAAGRPGRDGSAHTASGAAHGRPLSVGQRRLWLLNRIDPASAAYNVVFALRMKGPLDARALENALNAVVERHEILRTTFPTFDGEPVQMIAGRLRLDIPVIDATGGDEDGIESLAGAECAAPFDLANGPLVRPVLLRIDEGDHLFVATLHHIVCDAWSLAIFRRELAAFYNASVMQTDAAVPPASPFQYADFGEWEAERIPAREAAHLQYWKDQLSGELPGLDMPADRPRPGERSSRGSRYTEVLPPGVLAAVQRFGRENGATPFMTLLAALNILVHRYTGQQDVLVGAPISSRTRPEVENLIGFFTNTIVLRSRISPGDTVAALVRQVRDVCLNAYEHAELPFEKVVEAVRPRRDLVNSPIFQIMMQYRPAGPAPPPFVGLHVTPVNLDTGAAKFDLNFTFLERQDGLKLTIEYNTDIFERATMRRLARHLQTLLEGMVENPASKVRDVPLLPADERHRVLVEWNQTEADIPREQTIHGMFEAQAARSKGAVAVISGRRQLTYAQLDAQAERLANYLAATGAGRGAIVALCLERSIEAVVALLAVLKSGAAYLPLDPSLPKARLALMLADSGARIVLTRSDLQHVVPETGASVIPLDTEQARIARAPRRSTANPVSPEAPAYLIYTSGSTGTPKGVVIAHRSLVNLLTDMRRRLRVTRQDRFLALTTLSFDIATMEVFLALIAGASLVTAGPDEARDPALLAKRLTASGVTVMQATPATWRMLIERNWPGNPRLRAISGGEALPPDLAAELVRRCEVVWNLYGPTETTVYSTAFCVDPKLPVTIGSPISNTQAYILDASGNPVPVGVPGELFIAGAGVAIGYWKRPELTAERFVPNPFDTGGGPVLYKTGDRARFLEDGNIDYLGRADHQVKIRGFRVETGEIELALRRHPAVQDAAVLPREGASDLVAYIIAAAGETLSPAALRAFLQERLPAYMVPSNFVPVAEWPKTPSGKLDRKALAALPVPSPAAGADRHGPEDPLQQELVRIWEKVLGAGPVGVKDNFFELGGHSLLAARMFAEIERTLGRSVPVSTLYVAPTIETLARAIEQRVAGSAVTLVRSGGEKPPLFLIRRFREDKLLYVDLIANMAGDRPVFLVDLQQLDPFAGIIESAQVAVRAIREVCPAGPYNLGGACVEGLIAMEMAQQLTAAGEIVDLVALIDTFRPGFFRSWPLRRRALYQARRMGFHLDNLRKRGLAQRADYIANAARRAGINLGRTVSRKIFRFYRATQRELPGALQDLHELGRLATREYVAAEYRGRVVLIRPAEKHARAYFPLDLGWGELLPALDVFETPGDHITMLQGPFARDLAMRIERCFPGAELSAPPREPAWNSSITAVRDRALAREQE